MNLHLLNPTNWWCCVWEDLLNQIMPCISRHHCLCEKSARLNTIISNQHGEHMQPDPLLPCGNTWYGVSSLKLMWVYSNYLQLIFCHKIPLQDHKQYYKTPYILLQGLNNLCRGLKGNKLRPKTWILDRVIEFTVPNDRCTIDMDDDARMWPPICHVSCMVGIQMIFDKTYLTRASGINLGIIYWA